MIHHRIHHLIAGLLTASACIGTVAQTAGTDATVTSDSKAMAAGRHADGGTGVRKAQSSTTSSTGAQAGGMESSGSSASSAGSGGSASAGSGVTTSTVGTGGSSSATQSGQGSTYSSSTGPGASAASSGPSGASSSDVAGSKAQPTPGASGYTYGHNKDDQPPQGKDTAPGQVKKEASKKQ